MTAKVPVFGAVHWSWKTSISYFATIQTMKFDRKQRFLLRLWMQTFEQIIDWQNHSFIDALFIDLKMLQFFKVIVSEGMIFTDVVTKELTLSGPATV